MSSEPLLSFEQTRVLGCLLEKEMATPDYYPMTTNGLITACNQTTNREPVVQFDERTVEEALLGLRQKQMAAMVHLHGSRAPKFKHLLEAYFPGLGRPEFATLAVMLLRGPQTVAEIRARSERLFAFPSPEATEAALKRLCDYGNGPLATYLPPGSGRRVACYAQLLGGEPPASVAVATPSESVIPPPTDWKADVERELAALRDEIASLRERMQSLESALGGP